MERRADPPILKEWNDQRAIENEDGWNAEVVGQIRNVSDKRGVRIHKL